MPFYVPVGPRGYLFRFGSMMTGMFGSIEYYRLRRRRALLARPLASS